MIKYPFLYNNVHSSSLDPVWVTPLYFVPRYKGAKKSEKSEWKVSEKWVKSEWKSWIWGWPWHFATGRIPSELGIIEQNKFFSQSFIKDFNGYKIICDWYYTWQSIFKRHRSIDLVASENGVFLCLLSLTLKNWFRAQKLVLHYRLLYIQQCVCCSVQLYSGHRSVHICNTSL